MGVYEFGSVFKTFTLAAAFDQKLIEPNKIMDLPKSLTCAGFPIREYNEQISSSLTEQVLIQSGNIGSVRIGQKVGEQKFKSFLSKLGLIDKIDFDIDEVEDPLNLDGKMSTCHSLIWSRNYNYITSSGKSIFNYS